ncbi:MAG: molybdopterin cofactor-binding domain-containing protein, partial [Bacteroidota bacterium]
MNRRNFVRLSSLTSGGLLLSTLIPYGCDSSVPSGPDWEPNFFIKISPDNTVTFLCSQSEIGQGTSTGLAMIVADELGIRLEDLKLEFALGSAERYQFLQDTGGSNGTRMQWKPLRKAAALTREILKQAAAQKWKIKPSQCDTEDGKVIRKDQSASFFFGELLEIAAKLPAPREIPLRDKKEFKYIGQPISGPRNIDIVKGSTPYSINIQQANMVYAAIARCPVWGGQLQSFDATQARKFPGVLDVVEMEATELQEEDYRGGVRPGVAVLAENTWAALEAKKLLNIDWDDGQNARKSQNDLIQELEEDKNNHSLLPSDY